MKSNSRHGASGSLLKASRAYRALRSPSPKRHDAKAKPHFMSPTFSSSRQTTSSSNPPVTPESLRSVKTSKSLFGRVRDRKSETSHMNEALPEPKLPYSEKVKASIYETPPSQKRVRDVSSIDKPLPTPPSTAVDTSSPTKSATLLDATERPLRSPSHGGGDWPVLKPRRVVSTSPLQDVMRDTGAELKRQASSAEGERYPRLGDLTQVSPDHDLHSIYSPKPVRKETSSPALMGSTQARKTRPHAFNANAKDDPFRDSGYPANDDTSYAPSSSNLSASAAALEKSSSHELVEVRQTRTSSMRARLSAGEIVKDRNSKITGFTDFTNTDTSTLRHRDSLRVRKQASAEKEKDPKPPDVPTKKHSLESLDQAPTKLLTSIRRIQPRHSNSRGSLRDDSQASAGSSRPQTAESGSIYSLDRPASKGKDGHRSSIPVAKAGSSTHAKTVAAAGSGLTKNDESQHNNNGKYEPGEMQAVSVAISNLGEEKPTTVEVKHKANPLDSIEESPRHTYTFRRLSTKSPEFGPTLTISPNARRFIMGQDADKENKNTSAKIKRLSGSHLSSGTINGKISAVTKKRLERPVSSDGPGSHRTSTLSFDIGDKKSRSADVSVANGDHLSSDKIVSKKTSTNSSVTSPFYDASENLESGTTTPMNQVRRSIAQDSGWISPLKSSFGHEVTLLSAKGSAQPNGSKLAAHDDDEYDPYNYERQQGKTSKAEKAQKVDELKTPERPLTGISPPASYPPRSSSHANKTNLGDATPVQSHGPAPINTNPPSPMQPPVPHNTPAANHSPAVMLPPSPPYTPNMSGPPTPPKDFIRRQNNLGAGRGHASSQMDLLNAKDGGRMTPNTAYAATAASSARQSTTMIRPTTSAQPNTLKDKRSSIIGAASLRSQATLPKSSSRTRFNLRTLFHKKSTEPVSPKKAARMTKNKNKTPSQADITAQNLTPSHAVAHTNGSPFPPMNEVHPVHRPTARPSPRSSAFIVPTVSNGVSISTSPQAAASPITIIANRPATPPHQPSTPTHAFTNGASQAVPATDAVTALNTSDLPRFHHPTELAISLLARSRQESTSSLQKARLLELGKIMVGVITQARDAERAVEEAKMAVLKAREAALVAERARESVWKGLEEVMGIVEKEEGMV